MKDEKPVLGYDKFLMMALLKEGPLSLDKLWEKSILFLSLIWYQQLPEKGQPLAERLLFTLSHVRSQIEDGRASKATHSTEAEMEKLIDDGLVKLNEDKKYELTDEGHIKANEYEKSMQKEAVMADKELKPSTTAKNTTYLDAFLAVLKLGSGLITGSMGLIADGTDATMDTVEAILVWLGIKYHRENLSTFLVIFGLFIASISVLYDSITHLLGMLAGHADPMTMPLLVIAVEGIAILAAVFLFYYQRFVGNVSNSLTLISQSVDSKNHIFIGTSVIIGAIFAIYGVYFVDALIGLVVGANIFKDATSLLREAISAQQGEEEDYSAEYKLPLQQCWEENQLMAFRNWILYTLWTKKSKTRPDIIISLKKVFRPDNYIPVLSELNATCTEHYDFEGEFDNLLHPLKEHELLVEEIDEEYVLTENGEEHLKKFIHNFKYYDVHESDAILLAMAQDKKK
ncbi:MAG: cation transporter [Methanobacterium sp.]|uniref:cation diffusion facilitator family transporter n=1 Tax=Methanobacterium sp. TaxID=2164 RepID=UPI003D65724F|nr:cation transporter [Methanobacterium sp.]